MAEALSDSSAPQWQVAVEFFGVVRSRAGRSCVLLPMSGPEMTLAQVIGELSRRFPALARDCFKNDHVADGFLFSVAGEHFVTDSEQLIDPDKPLLLMSADAGG